jgi:DNA-directed RNA polymerase specialized sigma24 family protein
MQTAPGARTLAADVLRRVDRDDAFLAAALHAELKSWPTLDPRDAETLMLRFSGGLTLEELAQFTGDSKDAAHGRVRRALAALRTLLGAATHPASIFALVILHSRGGMP